MTETIRIFVVAGGRGNRLSPRTLGILPKSLIPLAGKPVISYQLQIYEKFGIKNITLSFNEQWQIDLYKKYIELGLVPNFNYEYHLRPYIPEQHHFDSLKAFLRNNFKSGVTIIFSAGDIVFTNKFFSTLLSMSNRNKFSILIKDKPDKAVKNRILTKNNLIYGVDPNKYATWTLNCFFLIQSNSIKNLYKASLKKGHRTLDFVNKSLSEDKKVLAIWPKREEFLNINSEKDYFDATLLVKNL